MTGAGLALLLGVGCSSVPDAINPVSWADSIGDYIAGDDEPDDPEAARRLESEEALGVPGEDEDFPTLGSVPDRAPTVTSTRSID